MKTFWLQFFLRALLVISALTDLTARADSATNKPLIVCLGDSITKRGYPEELSKLLGVRVVNAGVNGNTSRQGLARLHRDVLAHRPDVVVLFFGANDSRLDAPRTQVGLQEFSGNLAKIIEECKRAGAKVVLGTMPPIAPEPYFTRHPKSNYDEAGGFDAHVAKYREAALRVGREKGVTVLDLNRLLRKEPRWVSADGVHPTPEGNKIIAKLVARPVTTVLRESPAMRPARDGIVVIMTLDGFAAHYLHDPKAKIPTLRKLASEGAVAAGMKSSLPTMTWPNHVTLITGVSPGKHGVIGNNYLDRETGKVVALIADPLLNEDEIIKVPTLYGVAHDAGLKTAGINWPATRGAKALDWRTPDVHSNSLFAAYTTPGLLEQFRDAGIRYDKLQEYCELDQDVPRDAMYLQMLDLVVRKHRPNLALVHLVNVDHVHHAAGPRSAEAYESLTLADERVRDVHQLLEKEFPGRATLFVTSDHGFVAVRQKIQPNVKLRQAGLLTTDKGKVTERRVFGLSQGGSFFIYVLDKANRGALLKETAALFKGVEGVDRIILPGEFKKHGLVAPEKDPRMADIVLTAKEGFSFSNTAEGQEVVTAKSKKLTGSHGHDPAISDMHALFVAWGRGIQKGTKLGLIDARDVAPTAATLLGVKMNDVDGRVLKKALER